MSVYRRRYTYNGRVCETSVWWCSYYIDGRRYRESTGETAKKKAKEWERNRIVARTGSGFNTEADRLKGESVDAVGRGDDDLSRRLYEKQLEAEAKAARSFGRCDRRKKT